MKVEDLIKEFEKETNSEYPGYKSYKYIDWLEQKHLKQLKLYGVSKSVNCDYCKDLGRKYAGVTLGHTKCPECGKH